MLRKALLMRIIESYLFCEHELEGTRLSDAHIKITIDKLNEKAGELAKEAECCRQAAEDLQDLWSAYTKLWQEGH